MTGQAIEITVPALPESVADATVLTWHKKAGDTVSRDENLVDLETDKVILEVPAPRAGILKEIKKTAGEKVSAHELLGILTESDKNPVVSETPPTASHKSSSPVQAAEKVESKQKTEPDNKTKPDSQDKAKAADNNALILSPSARRAIHEHNSDSDKGASVGRMTRQSILEALSVPAAKGRIEKRVPMSRLRQRIAERLLSAQHNAAILTTFNEVNLQSIMALRAKYKEIFEKTHQVRLGFMSFFTRAVIEALKKFPSVNASIDGNEVIYHDYYDIGVAVSTERGLVVPVLRDADILGLAEIEKKVAEYGKRAKENQLTMEEITGGTFTITNGGVFGSLLSTPILNPPQSAILGMHKIEDRAVVENGQIIIRPMMYLALSYDHRIIDGKDSVRFLVTVKEFLEDPARILLEV